MQLAGISSRMCLKHQVRRKPGVDTAYVDKVANETNAQMFVVTQGHITSSNLSSYDVLQEESAWLAGAYAAMMTRTGVVAHQSGQWPLARLDCHQQALDFMRTASPGMLKRADAVLVTQVRGCAGPHLPG